MKKFESLFRSRLFLIFMMVFGIIILVYPIVSDRYYRVVHENINTSYEERVKNIKNSDIENIIYKSKKYNKELMKKGTGIYDTTYLNFVRESIGNGRIPEFFRGGTAIARIIIPKIDLDLPVYFGSDEDVLDKGAGMMYNTSLPVGGSGTHSVITAHRGMPQSRYFRDLGELKKGDVFLVSFMGQKRAYRVDDIDIIRPNDPSKLRIYKDKEYVTLLTCHPYMINSQRLIVRGYNIPYNKSTEKEVQNEKQGYSLRMFIVKYSEYFYGILIFLIILSVLMYREKRINKKI